MSVKEFNRLISETRPEFWHQLDTGVVYPLEVADKRLRLHPQVSFLRGASHAIPQLPSDQSVGAWLVKAEDDRKPPSYDGSRMSQFSALNERYLSVTALKEGKRLVGHLIVARKEFLPLSYGPTMTHLTTGPLPKGSTLFDLLKTDDLRIFGMGSPARPSQIFLCTRWYWILERGADSDDEDEDDEE